MLIVIVATEKVIFVGLWPPRRGSRGEGEVHLVRLLADNVDSRLFAVAHLNLSLLDQHRRLTSTVLSCPSLHQIQESDPRGTRIVFRTSTVVNTFQIVRSNHKIIANCTLGREGVTTGLTSVQRLDVFSAQDSFSTLLKVTCPDILQSCLPREGQGNVRGEIHVVLRTRHRSHCRPGTTPTREAQSRTHKKNFNQEHTRRDTNQKDWKTTRV